MSDTTGSVNVVIATFRRPDRLTSALQSLVLAADRLPAGWSAGVTVVDDDPDGSARSVADDFATAFVDGCRYVACGSRNISRARNAGLESALGRADWLGSIDDDVAVPVDWFDVCIDAIAGGQRTAVTGPLVKDFSNGPAWLTQEPFDRFGVITGVDGQTAFTCATGNYWISAAFLRERPELRFDPALGETGGEDMDFFYRAVEAGLDPVFSSRAAVVEKEPPARCTLAYQLRRAFWLGVSEGHISIELGKATRLRLLARSARRAANLGSRTLPVEDRSRRRGRFALAVLAQCAGLALGAFGFRLRHK